MDQIQIPDPKRKKKRRDETRCRGFLKPLTIPAKLPLAADVCGGRRTGPSAVEGASEAAEAGNRPGLEYSIVAVYHLTIRV